MHTPTAGHAPWPSTEAPPGLQGVQGWSIPLFLVLSCSKPPRPLEALCPRCAKADEPVALWTMMW